MEEWYTDTEAKGLVGEMAVPMISVLQGFVMGSGISRIVQCGHYSGYSTLLLGFMLRRMGRKHSLYSIDIAPDVTDYTQYWLDRSNLADYVQLKVSDSADAMLPRLAEEYLGGKVDCVIIDSSHQYGHTKRELELWYDALKISGLMFLHDTSAFAIRYDSTRHGGVHRALTEWTEMRHVTSINLNADVVEGDLPVYADGCGLAILQKEETSKKPYVLTSNSYFFNVWSSIRSRWRRIKVWRYGKVRTCKSFLLDGLRYDKWK